MMKEDITVRVIRSRRRTLGLQIKDGEVLVRVPLWTGDREVRRFIEEHRDWIEKQLLRAEKEQTAAEEAGLLSRQEIRDLAVQARKVIPQRVAYYAPLVGVDYGRISIRSQRSRWGSCSVKGNLNFNCLLMLTPPQVLDSVVVHELCHRKEMNHSRRFYQEVLRVFPEYYKWNRWLKAHGGELMRRMTEGTK